MSRSLAALPWQILSYTKRQTAGLPFLTKSQSPSCASLNSETLRAHDNSTFTRQFLVFGMLRTNCHLVHSCMRHIEVAVVAGGNWFVLRSKHALCSRPMSRLALRRGWWCCASKHKFVTSSLMLYVSGSGLCLHWHGV